MRTQINALFASLHSRPWSLTRTLHSDNPMDIKGELHGTATFTPCRQTRNAQDKQDVQDEHDMVYREEGEMPTSVRELSAHYLETLLHCFECQGVI